MEYPPLVAGQTALFAVHLTRLSDFSAMTAGRPRLEFTPESGGTPAVLQGNEPSRPGVFRVEAAAPAAGRYRWALVVDAPGSVRPPRSWRGHGVRRSGRPRSPTRRAMPSDDPVGDHLPEGTAMDEWLWRPRRCRKPRCAGRSACPPIIEPLTGGEAVVVGAGRRTIHAGQPAGGRRHGCSAGQELGGIQPRSVRGRRPIAPRLLPPLPRRRRRSRPRARIWRVPSGCSPSAPCRRGASRRRSAR